MKYAMPVDPRVLEKDYPSDPSLDSIPELVSFLKSLNTKDFKTSTAKAKWKLELSDKIHNLWYTINMKQGINLADREKLLPVFQELSRLSKPYENLHFNKLYRGVRASNHDPRILTYNYPDELNDPEVIEHLEGLAYGLRSWSWDFKDAIKWSQNVAKRKDRIIFELPNPSNSVVLDCDALVKIMGKELAYDMFDPNEIIVFLDNPKILNIVREEEGFDEEASHFLGDNFYYKVSVSN